VIAVDTNVLVYAHRRESRFHDRASACLADLAAGRSAWAIPWPCLHEFWGVVTNPRAFETASTIDEASAQIGDWLGSPTLILLHEGPGHWQTLQGLLRAARVVGGQVHDARIAAICVEHAVREFWTADRDFNRFPQLTARNPLVA
jgi:uncharacterized protein